MPLEMNIENIKWQFYDKEFNHYVKKNFQELEALDISMPKEDGYKIIEQVVRKVYEKEKNKLIEYVNDYNKLWEKYNDKYFFKLSEYFETDFPDNLKEIKAYVGFICVYPRYLDDFSFALCPELNDLELKRITAHETLHFIWFIKWKKLHPETPRDNYEAPHIEWEYSEMVTDPILNNKPFNEILNIKEKGYDRFYKLLDGDELVMDRLRNIYASNKSIEDKIDEGYDYIKSYNR